jgi:predicted ATPase
MLCRTLSELAIWRVSVVFDRALWAKSIYLWGPFGMNK